MQPVPTLTFRSPPATREGRVSLYWVTLDGRLLVEAACAEEAKRRAEYHARIALHYADAYAAADIAGQDDPRGAADLVDAVEKGDVSLREAARVMLSQQMLGILPSARESDHG